MMKRLLFVLFIVIVFLPSTYCQKGKVNAASTYITAAPPNFDKADQNLKEALGDIKTKFWPKTYWVRGKLYGEIYKQGDNNTIAKFGAVEIDTLLYTTNVKQMDDPKANAIHKAYLNYKRAFELDTFKKLDDFYQFEVNNLYSSLFNEGVEQFSKQKKYSNSIILWEDALGTRAICTLLSDKIDTGLIYNIALAAFYGKDYDKAIEYFKKANNLNYMASSPYLYLYKCYLEKGDSATVLQVLNEGFTKYPDDQEILIALINYYIQVNKTEEALKNIELAEEKDPTNSSLFHAEGVLYSRLDNYDKAVVAYKKAIELRPDFFDSFYNLGVLHYNKALVMKDEANEEKTDTKKFDIKQAEADSVFKLSLPLFERALEIQSEDMTALCETMRTLKALYYRFQMTDKYNEMKERMDGEQCDQYLK